MLRKTLVGLVAILMFGAVFAAPARAQSQAVSFNIGFFTIRGHACTSTFGCSDPAGAIAGTSREPGDILLSELTGGLYDALDFNLNDFNHVTFGGEYLLGISEFLEAGVGVGYYKSTVPSVSLNFQNPDGSLINQTLELRMVPINATIRFLPLGRSRVIEPYVGAGLGIFVWRYTEMGNFVFPSADPNAPDIVCVGPNCSPANPAYTANGTNVGPVILAGARFPFGNYAIGGEIKWQRATGTLPTSQFLNDKIDLGGISYQATFVVRFGGR